MRHLILAALLLAPAVAMADSSECKFHADRNLDLNLSGVRRVTFVTNAYELHVEGTAPAGKGTVRGKACASSQESLDKLLVTQEREGDTLVVKLTNEGRGWNFGHNYTDLKVDAAVPSSIPVTINVGSGEATARGLATLESTVGSGELEAHDIKGAFSTTVGSGEVKIDNTGAVDVTTVGSGSFAATGANGGVRIATVGSGEAKLRDITGDVSVGTVGSGEIEVDGVKGNLTVNTKGSGDITQHGVTGKVDVPRDR
ncbi:MAG TPA: DUF2807 domain-containing protein [Luteibacter sp.]|uniref:GIN domain-containing protein n=1 Tax=Luteibacter sp. TaxID=1886636 RepID=UPI002C847483|nr:DUF2807 domain-containing protein [Luteibacter sp.]HVI54988.1 DUF2807 domain-containing protein [Luteibacter sp.]